MNPILYLIYQFLKLLVKTCYRIFFSRSTVINREQFNISKPCILVSNHPSTLIDPLNVAKHIPATVFFLANASLFEKPFLNWFFNTFYCIPIERPQDVDGRKISNQDNFNRCDEFLGKGGVLYIAPEGTSVMEKHLRRVKTGTARIALSAESKNDFQLGLNILPVGLTYSSPTEFRSKTLINVGEPIRLADYASNYKEDEVEAVKSLTSDLQQRLGDLIYNTKDDHEEELLEKAETILKNEKPLPAQACFFRSKELLGKLRVLKSTDADAFQCLKEKLDVYFLKLQQNQTNDLAVLNILKRNKKKLSALKLILGFPFFLYGWLNNILAFILPAFLAKKLKLYIGYKSTVKILAGIISFPIFYCLQIWLVHHFFESSVLTGVYTLSLFTFGWFAWEYLEFGKQYFKNIRANQIDSKEEFQNLRHSLLTTLSSILSPKVTA